MKAPAVAGHKIRWFVYAWDHEGNRERMPKTATMRGFWGYDVECSCGWQSRTGGATRRYVEDQVWYHKFSESSE